MLDPYRILGVQPGASQAEIKRAYRLLVKAHHPDSAGPGEIERFLTIQRAYEALKTSSARRLPRGSRPAPSPPPPPPTRPWEADPERARTTRERAGARRPGARRTSGPGAPEAGTPPPGEGDGSSARGRQRTGRASAPNDASMAGGRSKGGRRRHTRKATFGSTTYDDARDSTDPTWSGAAWYGPSSGEYWTINPREYADPRKHGPEYLARARRPIASAGGDERVAAPGDESGAAPDAAATGDDSSRPRSSAAWPPPAERPRRADDRLAAGVRAGPIHEHGRASEPPGERVARPGPSEPSVGPWLDRIPVDARDPMRRLVLALVAWPPLGIAAATLAGTATGCIDAAATCTAAAGLLPWLLQAAILGILFALPRLAAILAAGSVALAVAAVPVTAVLVAVGANYDRVRGPAALGILLAVAWLAGVAMAVARRARRGAGAGDAPVS